MGRKVLWPHILRLGISIVALEKYFTTFFLSKSAVKLTVKYLHFGATCKLIWIATYSLCSKMMKVKWSLQLFVSHPILTYLSFPNGPSNPKKCSCRQTEQFKNNFSDFFEQTIFLIFLSKEMRGIMTIDGKGCLVCFVNFVLILLECSETHVLYS